MWVVIFIISNFTNGLAPVDAMPNIFTDQQKCSSSRALAKTALDISLSAHLLTHARDKKSGNVSARCFEEKAAEPNEKNKRVVNFFVTPRQVDKSLLTEKGCVDFFFH